MFRARSTTATDEPARAVRPPPRSPAPKPPATSRQSVSNTSANERLGESSTTVGLRVTPAEEEAKLRELGIRLPTVGRRAGDPRTEAAYIDKRLTKVMYGIYQGGYLLFVEGQKHPLLVPERLVQFGGAGAESVSNVVHRDYDAAIATVPYGPHPQAAALPYAYFYAPGGGHVIVPTMFTPATAPATVALIKETVLELVASVERQLSIVAVQIVGMGLARVAVPAAAKLGTRLGEGKSAKAPSLRPPADEPAPPTAKVTAPATLAEKPVVVPKSLNDPTGEQIVIKPVKLPAVYHSPGGSDPPPDVALRTGLPARGGNTNLWDHAQGVFGDSAFRGTTLTPGQAAQWDSPVVYKIRNVDTYDVNAATARIDKGIAGFSGNPMHGENEFAIKAAVPAAQIEGYYPVVGGKLGAFVPNPSLKPPGSK
jgi:hypothetical protein